MEENKEYECQFYACQFKDGSVVIGFSIENKYPFLFDFDGNKKIDHFSGETSDGWNIISHGPFNEIFFKPEMTEGFSGSWNLFHTRELMVSKTNQKNSKKYSFGITNFQFDSNHNEDKSLFEDEKFSVKIKKKNNYKEKMNNIKAFKKINVTGEIVIDDLEDKNKLYEIVDNICYLLSFARGTKIQYVYCKEENLAGDKINIRHFNRVTKPYVPFKVIDYKGNSSIFDFISKTYNKYVNNLEKFSLDKGIEALLDAKATQDFVELRGLKLANVLEILINSYVESKEDMEYVLLPKKYKEMQLEFYNNLYKKMKELEIDSNKIQALIGNKNKIKLNQLNRRSFIWLIKKLFKEIDFKYEYKEINLFKLSRNNLVHRGLFTSQIDSKESPFSNAIEEYMFMVNILHRIFLKTLKYKGEYINWSNPNNPIKEEIN
jgi:hypothetical protein